MRYFSNFLVLIPFFVFSQEIPLSMQWYERTSLTYLLNKNVPFVHEGFFPLTYNDKSVDSILIHDMLKIDYSYSSYIKNFEKHSFIQVKDNNFILHINPLVNFEFSNNEHHFSRNTRGIIISGQLDKQFRFVSGMIENQMFFESYINAYISQNKVVPGQGRSKIFKKDGYDFSNAFGYLTYNFSPSFQLLLGHTRLFTGYGYRSVLLSDNTLDCPTLRFSFTHKRIQYIAVYSVFQSASTFDDYTNVHTRKYSSVHYLNYFILPSWEIGIFENTLFQPMSLKHNGPAEEFFSPLLFSHYFIYGLRNRKNVMLGIQSQYSLLPQLKLYGQWALDDYKHAGDTLSKNKTSWQAGVKLNEPFRIKNLYVLAEINQATAGMYELSIEQSTFSNNNEPIAHPLGNHFFEQIFMARYSFKRVFFAIQINNAHYEANEKRLNFYDTLTTTSFHNLPHIFQYKVEIGYWLHRPSRLQAVAGIHIRKQSSIPQTSYYYIALRTSFSNFYDDF